MPKFIVSKIRIETTTEEIKLEAATEEEAIEASENVPQGEWEETDHELDI